MRICKVLICDVGVDWGGFRMRSVGRIVMRRRWLLEMLAFLSFTDLGL